MHRKLFAGTILGAIAATFAANDALAGTGAPTYYKDVAPIVQENCQNCHRPGQIGPFSLMDYRQVRGWAKMIREVVQEDRMPPWGADPHVGEWQNDRSLSQEEKDTIYAWIDGGMPGGDPADAPEPIEWVDGWSGAEPDIIFEMPETVTIDPTGVVPYQYFETPTNFTEDQWVQHMEIKPGNAKVVHHILIFLAGVDRETDPAKNEFLKPWSNFLFGWAPGVEAPKHPEGYGYKIPAGARLLWQVHYTPTGKTETDRSQFGITLAKSKPEVEVVTGGVIYHQLEIPPNEANYTVQAALKFPAPATIYSFTPHMHYRGKSYDYSVIYPDGKEKHLLSVPKYDFNWQIDYYLAEPLEVPAGAKIVGKAVFDNSENNPYNPDPDKVVRWGDQTWEEMMIGYFSLSWNDQQADPQQATD